jgi:hypothetical protein
MNVQSRSADVSVEFTASIFYPKDEDCGFFLAFRTAPRPLSKDSNAIS